MRRARVPLLLLVSLATLACVGEPGVHAPTERALQPDLRLGGADSGALRFSDIRDLEVGREGNLHVLDVGERAIRVFDASGEPLRRVGRNGRGPGEFLGPHGLALDATDHLFVYDPLQRRVSQYDADGAHVQDHEVPIVSFGPGAYAGIARDGRLVDVQQVLRPDTVLEYRIRRRDLRTAADEREPFPSCDLPVRTELRHEYGIAGIPYEPDRVWHVDPDRGVLCAFSSRAVAYRVAPGTAAVADSFVSEAAPASVTDEDRRRAREQLGRQPIPPAIVERALAAIPAVHPVLQGLAWDDEGRVWMQVRDRAGWGFHVFAPDGRWLLRLRVAERLHQPAQFRVRDGTLVAVVRDDDDVPHVVRYPLPSLP